MNAQPTTCPAAFAKTPAWIKAQLASGRSYDDVLAAVAAVHSGWERGLMDAAKTVGRRRVGYGEDESGRCY
jgi:hypothetical protein